MKFICKHCKRKDSYRLTKLAYDDMDYIGVHSVECKTCKKRFDIRLDGYDVRVVK